MNSQAKICSACGAALEPAQAFCSVCGRPTNADERPTYHSNEPAFPRTPTPPPPPPNFSAGMGTDAPRYQAGPASQSYATTPYESRVDSPSPQPPTMQPVPAFARPPQRRRGLKVGVTLLLVLLILGGAGYFTWNALHSSRTATNGAPALSSGTSIQGATADVKTTPINKTVTYADDTITIIDVKQATSFADEKTPGAMLRLDVKEQTGDQAPYFGTYGYSTGFHLILPDGNKVQIANIQTPETSVNGPPAQVARSNWLDFPVPVTTPPDQIKLVLGDPTEHQIELPLTSSADVSMYQPRTAAPNKQVQWGALNWTITNASWQLSAQGHQADKDMAYVVLTFKVDSTSINAYLDQTVSDAFHLMADGSTTNVSKFNTFPQTIAAGESGKTGTVGFLVPQNSTKYTLVLPVYDRGGVTSSTQVTADFQIS